MNYDSDFSADAKKNKIAKRILKEVLENPKKVTRDARCYRSGNVVVEYESKGKPSGIVTTKDSWWCFVLSGGFKDEVIIMVEMDRLKKIAEREYQRGNICVGGDSNTSKLIKIPVKDLLDN